MENLWERFDDIAKPEDVMEAKSTFEPIQPGEYDVRIEGLESALNKSDLPMLKGRFRLVDSNKLLFYNQNLQVIGHQWITDQNIAEVIALIEGIIGEDYDYTGLKDLAEFISEIPTGTDDIYRVRVSYGKTDHDMNFPELEIIVPEDVITDDGIEQDDDDSLPF